MEEKDLFDPWKYIDEIEMSSDICIITCDTRDFCCDIVNAFEEKTKKYVSKIYKKYLKDERYIIGQTELLPFLKELETISGGKGEWRFLDFKNIETPSGWGMKYLDFYRIDNQHFFIANHDEQPVEWRILTKENLCDEDILNFSEI